MYTSLIDIDKIGLSNNSRTLYCFLDRNSLVAKSRSILRLQDSHCISGNCLPYHRLRYHWRYLQTGTFYLYYSYDDILRGESSQQRTNLIH
jgi:hypothetical protein